MKQTAIEWLIGRFHYEGFIGTYCSEEQIKSKREMMIEIIDQAKAMEKEQLCYFYIKGVEGEMSNPYITNIEFYNKTFKKTKQ